MLTEEQKGIIKLVAEGVLNKLDILIMCEKGIKTSESCMWKISRVQHEFQHPAEKQAYALHQLHIRQMGEMINQLLRNM